MNSIGRSYQPLQPGDTATPKPTRQHGPAPSPAPPVRKEPTPMKLTITKKLLALVVVLTALASTYPASAFYNPGTGRWLSRDPVGENGGPNAFVAVNNSPTTRVDPLGLDSINICQEPEPNAVSWVIVDSKQAGVKKIKIGSLNQTSRDVTLTSEYGGSTVKLTELIKVAGDANQRFGFFDKFDEVPQKAVVNLVIKNPSTPTSFGSLDDAGIWGSLLARGKSVGNGWEWGGWIIPQGGAFSLKGFVTSKSPDFIMISKADNPGDSRVSGWFHNHPDGEEGMSGGDCQTQELTYGPVWGSLAGFAVSPKGYIYKCKDRSYGPKIWPK